MSISISFAKSSKVSVYQGMPENMPVVWKSGGSTVLSLCKTNDTASLFEDAVVEGVAKLNELFKPDPCL